MSEGNQTGPNPLSWQERYRVIREAYEKNRAALREAEARADLMHRALTLIGPGCQNYTSGIGSCWPHRLPDAEYAADRWCDGCIAAWGLGMEKI